jgi:ABC-type dipeptide/oligopeptide/nickel transport system permease subunit
MFSKKRGALGIGILILMTTVALGAPFLTPYDPVDQYYVSGDYATPLWLKMLPGQQHLSENLKVVDDSGFDKTSTIHDEWNFSTTGNTDNLGNVSITHSKISGSPNSPGGCAIITYDRPLGKEAITITSSTTIKFTYPYIDAPKRFYCNISLTIAESQGTERTELRYYINRIEGANKTKYLLWDASIKEKTTYWIMPKTIDSYSSEMKSRFPKLQNIPNIIFNSTISNTYEAEIQISFIDTSSSPTSKATVYLDDTQVMCLGTSFGVLGTDQFGRDIFSQLVYGARLSLLIGLLSAFFSVAIGLVVGVAAAYSGSIVDEVLMRFTDMLLVLPSLPLLLVLIAVLGPSLWNLILVIGLLGWMGFARIVRSQVLSLKERPFIEAAKAIGGGKIYIMERHIIPNLLSLAYVSLALAVPGAILSEAALSWLGLFDPTVVSWGKMLHDAMSYERSVDKWWWIVPPGLCIAITSLSFILLGYAMDEILNPKLRERK